MHRLTASLADFAPRGGIVLAAAAMLAATPAMAQTRGATPAPTGPVVVLEADSLVRDDASQLIIAEGSVEARYRGRTMRASRLIYDTQKGTLRAQGGVEIIEEDGSVRYAEELEIDDELNAGVAVGFGTRTVDGSTLAANAAVLRPNGEAALDRAVYTACRICQDGPRPTWTLRARRAEQDGDSKMIAYEGVSLRVRGVPVLYLPYFSHPDPTAGRRSGLLTPDIGQNRRLGGYWRQPYYWAISPSQDLTITPSLHENVKPIVLLEHQKRFWSGETKVSASIGYDQDFDGEGREFGDETFRGHIFGQGAFRIDDYWNWRFGIERTTDDLFLSRYDIEGRNERRGLYVGNATRLFSQVNLIGQDETSFAQFSVIAGQGLRIDDDVENLPTALPYGEAKRLFRDPVFDGQLKLGVSTANLQRSEGGLDVSRVSAEAAWRKETIVGPGLVFSPFAEGRSDAYNVRDNPSGGDETITRTVGVSGAELRWPFVRAGENTSLLIEPVVVAALGSSGGNDPDIPNEDSERFEVDDTSVFRPTATPNYDLWEPGARLSVGVRATAQLRNGGEGRLLIGRRFRDKADATFDEASNLDGTSSDYVGAMALDFGRPLRSDVRFRLDEDTLSVNRIDASVSTGIGRVTGQARYFFVEESLRPTSPNEEVSASANLALTRRWSVGTTVRRDLNLDKNLQNSARLTYQDDCTFFEVSYDRSEADERLGPNEGFRIRVGLKTLGGVGAR